MNRIKGYAKKTFLALKDPYKTIDHVFVKALDSIDDTNGCQYLGVKNVRQTPPELVKHLEHNGFVLHTIDKHSHNGRAVDYQIDNPITGRPMTGSSSGTAVNVFLGINDLGIGTDGGGSVLAPAIAVNCFGFISPLIEAERMKQYNKLSTDGIEFYPSIGYITRDLDTMEKAINSTVSTELDDNEIVIHYSENLKCWRNFDGQELITLPKCGNDRKPMIDFLDHQLETCDVFVDYEHKIDFYGLGDTVLGHFDPETAEFQEKSRKGLIRVANMVKATALTIPTGELSSGITLYCKSEPKKIAKLLMAAREFCPVNDDLVERYFRNPDAYFEEGFFWNH